MQQSDLERIKIQKRIETLSFPSLQHVTLYLIHLEGIQAEDVEAAKEVLTPEEIQDCLRYKNVKRQEQALITQACLRHLIGPGTIKKNRYGKPYLEGSSCHFNLSHTEGMALIGISSTPIGVDIEKILQERVLLDTPLMSASEQSIIKEASDPADMFFSYWCAKEALLKARGTGFQTRSVPSLTSKSGVFYSDQDQIHVFTKGRFKLAICYEAF